MNKKNSYFSVSFELIITARKIPYDLFVNSSASEAKEKFVRVFPQNEILSVSDLELFKKKYFQLYVSEDQREEYLKSLIFLDTVNDVQKTDIIKNSAIHYLDKLFDPNKQFSTEFLTETIQGCKTSVESMVDVIKDYDVSKLQNLIASLSFHDFYTYDHSINVSMYCISLFTSAYPNASRDEIVAAGMGGLLHDIGKIKIPTDLINKPDKLTDDEFNIIKNHPDYGLNLLNENVCTCEGINLDAIKRVVHEHHENFNGTGYPEQKNGKNIHVMARITAIADFFDAITTKRSYHEVLSTESALQVISKSVGKKIDPELFDVFTRNVKQLIFNGKATIELPESFDPCQPQNELPFQQAKPSYKVEGFLGNEKDQKPGLGKIKVKAS